MASKNVYHVTAFDMFGGAILTERTHYATAAERVARELIHYPNVGSVDVTVNDQRLAYRMVKLDDSKGLKVKADGTYKNIRF